MRKQQTVLKPIERTEKELKKVKNTWAGSVTYLQDLKTKKSSIVNQLQTEVLAITQHTAPQRDSDPKERLSRVSKITETPESILSLTGFDNFRDSSVAMFQVLGFLEVQAQAYLESDLSSINQHFDEKYQTRDRLLAYFSLLSCIKKKFSCQHKTVGPTDIKCSNLEQLEGTLLTREFIKQIQQQLQETNKDVNSSMEALKLASQQLEEEVQMKQQAIEQLENNHQKETSKQKSQFEEKVRYLERQLREQDEHVQQKQQERSQEQLAGASDAKLQLEQANQKENDAERQIQLYQQHIDQQSDDLQKLSSQLQQTKQRLQLQESVNDQLSNKYNYTSQEYEQQLQQMQDQLQSQQDQTEQIKQLQVSRERDQDKVQQVQDQHQEACVTIKELRDEIKTHLDKIKLLEQTLRQFTSNKKMNYDDTYEAVLREEFELMRQNYEKIVADLREEVKAVRAELSKGVRSKDKEIQELRLQREQLSDRLVKLKLKAK